MESILTLALNLKRRKQKDRLARSKPESCRARNVFHKKRSAGGLWSSSSDRSKCSSGALLCPTSISVYRTPSTSGKQNDFYIKWWRRLHKPLGPPRIFSCNIPNLFKEEFSHVSAVLVEGSQCFLHSFLLYLLSLFLNFTN